MSNFRRTDVAWKDGMAYGPGGRATGPFTYESGSGTSEDPNVYWQGNPRLPKPRRDACTAIARDQGIARRLEVVVIRSPNHNTVIRRDATGNVVTNRDTGRAQTDPSDWHMTLTLGHSLDDIVLQGHVYVDQDENRVPTGVMSPEDRTLIHPGKERCAVEYYGVNGSLGYVDAPVDPIPAPAQGQDGVHPVWQADSWRRGPGDGQGSTTMLHVNFNRNGGHRVDSQYYQRNGNQRNVERPFRRENAVAAAPAPAVPNPWVLESSGVAPPTRVKGPGRGAARNRFSALPEE